MDAQEIRLRGLLIRAHDMLCAVLRDNSANPSDIIDDIRVALDLRVTDCPGCRACIAVLDAVECDGKLLCADCVTL